MNNRDNHISKLLSNWLDKFDPEDRSSIEELWKKTGKTDQTEQLTITEEEKSRSLDHIKHQLKLDTDKEINQETGNGNSDTFRWTWIAAAATVLVAAGLSYILIPVREVAPYGQQKTVQLPDDTRVRLNSGTTLTYSRLFGYTNRNMTLDGEAFFEVEPDDISFNVQTFNASVKVLGTKFNLRSHSSDPASETVVTLTEGKLSFQPSNHPENEVILNPGEKSSLKRDQLKPSHPGEASIDQVLSWLEHRINFERRPLFQIIGELERRFDITIQVKPQSILSDSLTIYYSGEVTAEQVIQDICLSQGLHYRTVNNGFVIEQ